MKNLYLIGTFFLLYLTGNAQCITNGNFEMGVTTNYTFRINPDVNNFIIFGCNVDTSPYGPVTISSVPNQFSNPGGTIVDGNSSESYGPYDETLFALQTFIYRVSPATGGTKAIKLNNNSGSADITSMSVQVASAPQNIMFDYSIVTQNPHPENPSVQPFFAVRMYDVTTGNMVYNDFCVKADATDTSFTETLTGDVLYTDWQCGSLAVPSSSVGHTIRVEFVIADCGEGGHFGTVYIDNIRCGTSCNVFGKIAIDEVHKSCPDQPFNVCGSFVNPTNATLNSIALSVINENGNITQLNLTPTIVGNTFCFSVNPSLLGSNPEGAFKFRATANFQGPSGTFNIIGASPSKYPDVMFGELEPNLNVSLNESGDTLIWDDVDEEYTLEFRSDSACCPKSPESASDPEAYYTTTTTNNYISLGIPFDSRCFRWRIKTKCGWSGWCCLGLYDESTGNSGYTNPLFPECYIGDLCEDTITIPNISDNTVMDQKQRLVDKEVSIIAYNTFESGSTGVYRAGSFIELLPYFIAKNGALFTATIDDCVGAAPPASDSNFRTSNYSEYDEERNITTATIAPDDFVVYPNPTKGLITISGKFAELFTVIDINGKEVLRVKNSTTTKEFNIDLSRLDKGIYFLTADGQTIQKVIKQ